MSRTTMTVGTAILVALVSTSAMLVRYLVLGEDVKMAHGSWKVTLVVQGESHGDARVMTTTPPDFGRQHIAHEACQSQELLGKLPEAKHPDRRYVLWTRRGGPGEGSFPAHYDFQCKIDMHRPTSPMNKRTSTFYVPPKPGDYLEPPTKNASENAVCTSRAL